VALHGLGDRPAAFAGLLSDFDKPARIAFPRAPDPWGSGYTWFPYRDGPDENELARGIAAAAKRVAGAVESLTRDAPTSEVIVTGFSQGGMLSFALAVLRPELFVRSIPISGMLPKPLWPSGSAGPARLPAIVALHGVEDPRVPIGSTRRAVAALSAHGYHAELFEFESVGHSVSPEMRRKLLEELSR
jgi:phospholipase/carboxylesterase